MPGLWLRSTDLNPTILGEIMSIEVNILDNLNEVGIWLKDLGEKGLATATKRAMLKTRPTFVRESRNQLKNFKKINNKAINDRFVITKKLDGNLINKFEINLAILSKPIRAIKFIKGRKVRQAKKGIKVKRRRKLKIEVKPGKVSRLKNAFIEKGRGGTLMVLRRQTQKPRPTRIQSGIFIHHLFKINTVIAPIIKGTEKKLVFQFKKRAKDIIDKKAPR